MPLTALGYLELRASRLWLGFGARLKIGTRNRLSDG